jgi:hypothetical protein
LWKQKLNTMRNEIETIEKNNYKLEIFQDENPESPRTWDNLGTMICFHRRYNLGDKHDYNADNYSGWDEQKEDIMKQEDVCVILPLYLYDHSGITMSTSPFSCRWDSGQVGWILVSKEKVRKEYNVKRITQDIIDKVTKVLKGEVETYDQYLTGDVYGYRVSKVEVCDKGCEHDEEVDSCWGYYGIDSVKEEGMSVLEHYTKEEVV